MTENKYLRLAFWFLAYITGGILMIGMVKTMFNPGPMRFWSMILLVIIGLGWSVVCSYGNMAEKEMA